jgi:uncharacterized membrane protein YedE/YeeE
MTTMSLLGELPMIDGVRWIDLAAFLAMGLLWVFVLGMLFGIYRIIRSKDRGDAGWGDSPGM